MQQASVYIVKGVAHMKKLVVILIFLLSLVLYTKPVFADVDYAIKDVKIDAFLMENGNVMVKERFTYHFEGEFNGITRTIIPKKGTSIKDFAANEDGKALKIEKEDNEYRIYRSGKRETVTVEIRYAIDNGVEVYKDVAQFYWPFFDSSNESVYENMTIQVHPPTATNDVTAYGYDEAYGTSEVTEEGAVVFSLGYVEDESDGDIQVVYDATLFSAAPLSSEKVMRDSIMSDIDDNEADLAAFQDRKDWLDSIAPYVIGIFGVYFVVLLFVSMRKNLEQKLEVQRSLKQGITIPKLDMSLPATIYYTNPLTPNQQLLTTSLLELVRKGYVQSNNEEEFRLDNRHTEYEHESLLIDFLFDVIGDGTVFRFDDLKTFIGEKSNHAVYNEQVHAWLTAIQEEVKSSNLTKAKAGFRWAVAFSSLLLIPLSIVLGIHELFMWMFFSIILMFSLIGFSIFYNPRTLDGAMIWEQWKQFKKNFGELTSNQALRWGKDDQIIAVNYAYGIGDQKMIERNKTFFYQDEYAGASSNASSDTMNFLIFFLIATSANQHFSEADTAAAATSSTSSTIGTGTGVGGGGGGSGAF